VSTEQATRPDVLDKAQLMREGFGRHDADRITAEIGFKVGPKKWYVRREKLDAWIAKREGKAA
jgi:hypothetical protein